MTSISRGLDAALSLLGCTFVALGLALPGLSAHAASSSTNLPISARDASLSAPAGAGGDSFPHSITPDGRFLLFSSAARNLVAGTGEGAMPDSTPNVINVYLRDRLAGVTTLISVSHDGHPEVNADCLPVGVSTNGQHVAFESRATNLVPGDTNNASDVFLRDTITGTTVLVSSTPEGGFPKGSSRDAAITPDGRFVVFVSEAENVVPGDTNRIPDIFIRDMQTGATRLVSLGAIGFPGGLGTRGASEGPILSPDGRFVTFFSSATNLVSDPIPLTGSRTPGRVYRRDLTANVTTWVSREAETLVGEVFGTTNFHCFNQAMSADGGVIAYVAAPEGSAAGLLLRTELASDSTQILHTNAAIGQVAREHASDVALSGDGRFVACVVNGPAPAGLSVFVWDAQGQTNGIVSADSEGNVSEGSLSTNPVFEYSGTVLAFISNARNLVVNTPSGEFHLFLRNLVTGETIVLNDVAGLTYGDIDVAAKPLLTDASKLTVAFAAFDPPSAFDNVAYDTYVRDLTTNTTELISAKASSLPSWTANRSSGPLTPMSFSADGRLVAFWSWADDLVPGDTNGCPDVFVRDLVAGTNLLVSINTNSAPGIRGSYDACLSADGRFVAFTCNGGDMAPADQNDHQDVYVRDLRGGVPVLASMTISGIPPDAPSENPILTGDGKGVIFRSTGVFGYGSGGGPAAYYRDLELGASIKMNPSDLQSNRAMPDPKPGGSARRYFAFFEDGTTAAYVWDSQLKQRIYTNVVSSTYRQVAMHPSGKLLAAYHLTGAGKILAVYDLEAKTNALVPIYGLVDSFSGLAFSENGRYLVYSGAAGAAQWTQVYVYDLETGTNMLISTKHQSSTAGNHNSDMPAISPDGRFIAYRTLATDILLFDTNNTPDLLLYDQVNRTTIRIGGAPGPSFGPGLAVHPVFAPDGGALFFTSLNSPADEGDYNRAADIYVTRLHLDSPVPVFSTSLFLQGNTCSLTWTATAGVTYRVQARAALDETFPWVDLDGPVWVNGNQASFADSTPGNQRFYRVIAIQPLPE